MVQDVLTKVDYIKWLNKTGVFIEDNEANVKEVRKLNIRSFVVSQPWNSSTTKMNDILQVLSSSCNNDGVWRINSQ